MDEDERVFLGASLFLTTLSLVGVGLMFAGTPGAINMALGCGIVAVIVWVMFVLLLIQ